MLTRFLCWIRGGHRWEWGWEQMDTRECTRCGHGQYVWAETADGEKSWTAR